MTDTFTRESKFSLGKLREDEEALDEKASLVDSETDIDNRTTARLIWRCLLLIRFYWKRFAVVLSMGWVIQIITTAVAPWIGKVLVDQVVLGNPLPEDGSGYPTFLLPVIQFLLDKSAVTILFWLACWTLAGIAFRIIWHYVSDLIELRMQHSLLHMVRSRLFEGLRLLPITKLDNQPIGDSVFRAMHDVHSVPSVVRWIVQILGWAVVTIITAAYTMTSAYPDSPILVWLAVGSMPIFLLVTTPFSRMIRRRAQASAAAGAVFVSTTEEGMDNIQAVQSLGVNEIEKERFALASANSFRRDRYLVLVNNLVTKLGESTGRFLFWGVMLYVLGKVVSGEMTPGDYAVVIGYFMAVSEPAGVLAWLWIGLQEPAAKARRVFAMLDMEQEKIVSSKGAAKISESLLFEDVGFVYPDGRRALAGVSFKANIGEIIALAGPTGAGKTTLAYLIARYHTASEGYIRIDGQDINDVSIDDLRSQITYVFQETETLAVSIADNIRYGKPDATIQEVIRVAKVVGIHDFINNLPEGYETCLGTTNSKLSVGQKQRISIARGLIRETPILILDEPTSALDPETEAYLIAALQEAARGRIVLIIAHRLSTIMHADRIVFLENGRVQEEDSHDNLMSKKSGRYKRFVELQSR
ncbi:MAG: ABC transporter ATP-binding protein [Candidatus Azotimanducaceae bacterium]|uniref:ABC transporter ATP-binding protein n=1 Tax=OM182 bacterium TaxID=2510334 RepID=A0A520S2G7_9GAMM|nr:MAG: ABC transporter ATP-binding protein [OM182 bacterium]